MKSKLALLALFSLPTAFLNADKGGDTGPGEPPAAPAKPKTLAAAIEQLAALRAEADTAKAALDSATSAHADALAAAQEKHTTLAAQYDALAATASAQKVELENSRAEAAALIAEGEKLNVALTEAAANITRLEAHCAVLGVDPKSAVPQQIETPSAKNTMSREQFNTLSPAARVEFVKNGGKLTD